MSPRKRMLDPSFWEDLTIGQLSRDARLCFIGMIAHADDHGRLEADPRYIKRAVFGFDDDLSSADVAALLAEVEAGCPNVIFYVAGGRRLAAFRNWERYQYIQKVQASKLPPPPDAGALPDQYDTATGPVSLNRIEKNRREQNADGGAAASAENGKVAYQYDTATLPDAAAAALDEPCPIEEALLALGLTPRQVALALARRPSLTLPEVEQCRGWLERSTARQPLGALMSFLESGRVPPAPRKAAAPAGAAEDLTLDEVERRGAAYRARRNGAPQVEVQRG